MNTRYLTVAQVLTIHQQLMLDYGQDAQLVSWEKLASAVARPATESFGQEFFATLSEKAAALLQAIVIAHPFVDGNKRAGLGAMLAFLRLNNVRDRPDLDELYDLVIAVTTGELREIDDIAARLRGLFPGLG